MEPNKQSDDVDALERPNTSQVPEQILPIDEGVHEQVDSQNITSPRKSPKARLKDIWRKLNIYLLIFILLVVVTIITAYVAYVRSQNQPQAPATALQDLTSKDLQEIASGNANIGDPRYILNVQSDAIFSGSALVKGDLNVAGNIQLGQQLNVPGITVPGTANIATVQTNNLTVSGTAALQGRLAIQDELSVGKSLTVGGSITASQITTGSLTLGGNGTLTLNNHLRTGGPTPGRSQGSAVGSGGSTSISGSDLAGTLNINTGSGTAPGCFATITFAQRYGSTPRVVITPVGSAGASTEYYVDRSATNFSICTASAAAAGRSFAFDYFVVN